MTAKVIAVANMKGGVGKTTTVVGLTEALAASGANVLAIDLDPQASASICLAGDAELTRLIEDGRTLDAFLEDRILGGKRINFAACIRDVVSRVTHRGTQLPISLLASSPALRLLEREIVFDLTGRGYGLNAVVGTLQRLMKTQMERAAEQYDFIVLDCAPGISALTEASVRQADIVVVPTIPDFLSTVGLQAFCRSLWKGPHAKRSALAAPSRLPHVLITRRRPTREHNRTAQKMRAELLSVSPSFFLLDVEFPETTAIAEGLGKTNVNDFPTFSNKWGSNVVPLWERLAFEIREALDVP